ncbi:hypothetical protein DFH29DRAFT_1001443 [Suillus ampliporus]|nr:hypothetical protein DFH29DRAFT_1001443 [Suillus ampliporus]
METRDLEEKVGLMPLLLPCLPLLHLLPAAPSRPPFTPRSYVQAAASSPPASSPVRPRRLYTEEEIAVVSARAAEAVVACFAHSLGNPGLSLGPAFSHLSPSHLSEFFPPSLIPRATWGWGWLSLLACDTWVSLTRWGWANLCGILGGHRPLGMGPRPLAHWVPLAHLGRVSFAWSYG